MLLDVEDKVPEEEAVLECVGGPDPDLVFVNVRVMDGVLVSLLVAVLLDVEDKVPEKEAVLECVGCPDPDLVLVDVRVMVTVSVGLEVPLPVFKELNDGVELPV